MAKRYKLYLLFKGHKRFTFERDYQFESQADMQGKHLMKDPYLKHVLVDYKVV